MTYFIDCPDGSVVMPFCSSVLEAAELAKELRGRLRMPLGSLREVGGSTVDPMVGCVCLGDWRPSDG